ncbi:hypothetical protein PHYBOEH_001240 [Phytophthora boehmeriae]|uniref:RxLR effector protein n=1 Tax=Phytophthora boehmeriae TaxID=109152 RepID=A0A8T1V986_9STRA|nr:hypothetical protein PHYBOEH_001240 [Phytophthora boehmeriae]
MKLLHHLLLSAVWVAALVASKAIPIAAEALDVSYSGSGSWDDSFEPFSRDGGSDDDNFEPSGSADDSNDNSFESSDSADESEDDSDLLGDSDDRVGPFGQARTLAQVDPNATPHLRGPVVYDLPVDVLPTPPTEPQPPSSSAPPARNETKPESSDSTQRPEKGDPAANLRGHVKGGKL